jgi:hypothetical protein
MVTKLSLVFDNKTFENNVNAFLEQGFNGKSLE